MADSMTPGNRLYIYRLLSEQLGFGKQVTIERGEEILAADDVQPLDVGFDTFRAMMESRHFQGAARVEVFKKGRVLLTMLRSPELDEALAQAAKAEQERAEAKAQPAKPAGKQAKSAQQKGGKAQWAGVKATTKPSKPGEARRKKEAKEAKLAAELKAQEEAKRKAELEAQEAAARAEAERIAREEAERIAREEAERKAREAEERAAREAEERRAAELAREQARQQAAQAQKARVTTPISQLKAGKGLRVTYDPYAGIESGVSDSLVLDLADSPAERREQTAPAAKTAHRPAASASRAASTPHAASAPTARPAHPAAAAAPRAASMPRSTSAPRAAAASQAPNAPQAAPRSASTPATKAPVAQATAPIASAAPVTVQAAASAAVQPAPTAQAAPSVASTPAPTRVTEVSPAAPTAPAVEPAASVQPAVVQPTAAPEPVATPQLSEAPAPQPASPSPAAAPLPTADAAMPAEIDFSGSMPNPYVDRERQIPSAEVLASYPKNISRDVFCPTAILSTLSRILPVGIDLMGTLDEDWACALSTGMVSGSRNRACFPLRYLREDGQHPLELTLKRTGKPGANMRWSLALIDGDDGTGDAHETASLEGLPLADDGAWSDLGDVTPKRYGQSPANPIRELARFARIGSWDAVLGDLARLAAPERWSYPGTAVKPSSTGATRYGILREYLATTFHRVQAQGRLCVSAGGDFAAFNTGLTTPTSEDIIACLEYAGGSDSQAPWNLAGFACAGMGELGRRITAELPEIPAPASYLSSLDDVMPQEGSRICLDFRTLLDDCLGRLPRGFLRDALADMEGPSDMLARMGDASLPYSARREAQVSLARFISGTPVVYHRLTRMLEDAAWQTFEAAHRSYRMGAPVFDPVSDSMALLLPLSLLDVRKADVALVIRRQPSGFWQGTSLISLARAYACARVVSPEQPRWLSPEVALAQ